ncbi:MAG TPA: nuclear transport factor 2 family protein [Flavitalea sp.]|nr:nuclear transport factor 2 family protein [Flavitalea sp.]
MKKFVVVLTCLFQLQQLFAQEASAEADIRKLEEQERQAVLKKDTAMLRKIWDRHFLVNAPNNRIAISDDAVARPVITQMSYASFTREIEQILVRGDVVFSMGSEIVVPAEGTPNAGAEIKRRYTNIWMKQSGAWMLVARHASVICD